MYTSPSRTTSASTYTTFKATPRGRAQTLARKQARSLKYSIGGAL